MGDANTGYIVIDTGVLISAATRPQSVPALALERALRHYEVCASSATLGELQQMLLRPKFDRYASAAQRQVFLDGIVPHLTQMHPWRGIPILPPAAFLGGARS